jgi:peptidoglycan/LPS O-acetylase OafA/YrhL
MQISLEDTRLLKGGAIILIMLYHACAFLGLPNISQGQVGVDIFIFLSGYGIYYSAQRYSGEAFKFLKYRLSKLYLPYLIIVLLGAYFLNSSATDLALHLSFLQCTSANYCYGIDNALWFMSLLAWLYCFVAVFNRPKTAPYMLALGLCFSILILCIFQGIEPMTTHLIPRVPIFFIGYYLASLASMPNRPSSRSIEDAVAIQEKSKFLNPALCIAYFMLALTFQPLFFFNIGAALVVSLIIFQMGRLADFKSFLMLCGNYAFELYLVHDFVMRFVLTQLKNNNSNYKYMTFTFISVAGILICTAMLKTITEFIKTTISKLNYGIAK